MLAPATQHAFIASAGAALRGKKQFLRIEGLVRLQDLELAASGIESDTEEFDAADLPVLRRLSLATETDHDVRWSIDVNVHDSQGADFGWAHPGSKREGHHEALRLGCLIAADQCLLFWRLEVAPRVCRHELLLDSNVLHRVLFGEVLFDRPGEECAQEIPRVTHALARQFPRRLPLFLARVARAPLMQLVAPPPNVARRNISQRPVREERREHMRFPFGTLLLNAANLREVPRGKERLGKTSDGRAADGGGADLEKLLERRITRVDGLSHRRIRAEGDAATRRGESHPNVAAIKGLEILLFHVFSRARFRVPDPWVRFRSSASTA